MSQKPRPVGSGDVFRDLGFTREESAVLTLKSHLFIVLEEAIAEELKHTSQSKLAARLETTQPIVSNIANGKMSSFTLDRIIQLLLKLRRDVQVVAYASPSGRKRGAVILDKPTRKRRRAV